MGFCLLYVWVLLYVCWFGVRRPGTAGARRTSKATYLGLLPSQQGVGVSRGRWLASCFGMHLCSASMSGVHTNQQQIGRLNRHQN